MDRRNAMTMLERVENFKRLWVMAVPRFPVPADAQIFRWVSRFPDSLIEYGLGRLGTKSHVQVFTDDSAQRYLTGVLINEQAKRQETR
jgi:hypothetical protein